MPGRVPTRSGPRQSGAGTGSARKSSAPTPSSRASRRVSVQPVAIIPPDTPSTTLRSHICAIFAEAQKTTAGQRKLVINLRKIQESCCYEPPGDGINGSNSFDEALFNAEVGRCVVCVLGVKKGEAVGDKVVRFLGTFLKHANEKDAAALSSEQQPADADETEIFPETPSTRLTTSVLSLLLQFLEAKEKTVRYRATQLISHIINSLESIDDDLFQQLRNGLVKRIRDKESTIRVQAILGLGRLAGNEMEGEREEGESGGGDEATGSSGLLEKLLDVLQNDPSADVRRSLLLNLPLTSDTLPYLLERARDQDPQTRRALYSRLLPALGDFRHLSLSMREKLLRWGLRDRDENVRKAAGKLFRERWIEDCAGPRDGGEEGGNGVIGGATVEQTSPPKIEALLELLERIDVVNSGVATGVALEAMKGFWEGRPDYRHAVTFDDVFWDNLSAESIFMVRSYNSFCREEGNGKFESLVEEKMPEVTKFAFYLQRYTDRLIESLKKVAERGDDAEEDDMIVEQEFVVEQMLHIAQSLDYSDEVGRRKTFALLREILAIPELPEESTKLVVEVLRGVCGSEASGEREFCGVVLEAVAEVHDTISSDAEEDEEDSFHSAQSELSDATPTKKRSRDPNAANAGAPVPAKGHEQARAEAKAKALKEIMVNMKCLHIARCMLENVEGNLQDNVHLMTMLNNLVVPAVRSHEAPIRERGLLCLGLCCLLDKTLAQENLTLFVHCFNRGHDALQVSALHVLSDILTAQGSTLMASEAVSRPLLKVFTKALRADDKPDVQAAACGAICKLMLGCVLKDEDLLRLLVVTYFDPATAANLGLRQTLSYFLPVYCHSRRENQDRMQRVAVPALHTLVQISDGVAEEDDDDDMVSLSIIAAHLVDWTDPRKVVLSSAEAGVSLFDENGKEKPQKPVNGNVHLDLARDVIEKMSSSGCNREEKKILAGMLSKLYVTSNASAEKLRNVFELATTASEDRVLVDAPSRNSLNKLLSALGKVMIMGDAAETRAQRENTARAESQAPTEGGEAESTLMSVEKDGQSAAPPDDLENDMASLQLHREDAATASGDVDVDDTIQEEDEEIDEEVTVQEETVREKDEDETL
ncbi:MAG: hypothetical protein M1825_005927 [Sarcosagium campestre]|nr:MAG: hypothetical protein M1825_005927 [Sarcosagium campestre]